MKKLILFVLVFILAACTAGAPSEFERNAAKWNDAGVSHYRFSLFIGCFCPFAQDMPLIIEVKDGKMVSITRFDGTPIETTDPAYEIYTSYATIDLIFLKLEEALSGEAEGVIVAYDSVYGYPANIAIDYIKEAIDDELSFQISNFEVLE
jgi:hypothetical protein